MNYIERLLTGAIEKNISARPKCGNYKIDIEYIKFGVKYILIKKDMMIATVTKYASKKKPTVELTPLIYDDDTDRVFFAVQNCIGDFDVLCKK